MNKVANAINFCTMILLSITLGGWWLLITIPLGIVSLVLVFASEPGGG